MSARETRLQELHEALADIYSASPYATVDNTHTRALWNEIERLEADA